MTTPRLAGFGDAQKCSRSSPSPSPHLDPGTFNQAAGQSRIQKRDRSARQGQSRAAGAPRGLPRSSPIARPAAPSAVGRRGRSERSPGFPREEEPVLADFQLTPTDGPGECDRQRANTGVIASPRQGEWRLAAAYARSDRLTPRAAGSPSTNPRSTSSTIATTAIPITHDRIPTRRSSQPQLLAPWQRASWRRRPRSAGSSP